jgi:hypothetical protein
MVNANSPEVVKGRLIWVENKNPKPGSAKGYWAVWVEDADGSNERCMLLTNHAVKVGDARSTRNVEDLTKRRWWRKIFD